MEELRRIADQYTHVEFAVLLGTNTRGTMETGSHPLFPPIPVIQEVKALGPKVNTAIHLCGTYARATMKEGPMHRQTLKFAEGFGRVQVNLHGDRGDPSPIDVTPNAFCHFVDNVKAERVILQHRGPWGTIPLNHPKVEYLFDVSEGRGQESFELWPEPPLCKRVGYAGGLGPHNIRLATEFAALHPRAHLWLDMESQIRTFNRFDLDKVRAVCKAVF